MAGWDKHEGGAVYAIPLGGTLIKVPFTIGELLVYTVSKIRHPCYLPESAGLLMGGDSACTPQDTPRSDSRTQGLQPARNSLICCCHAVMASVHRTPPSAVQAALVRHTSWGCVTSCGGPT